VNLKTVLGWAAVAFLVWFVIMQPGNTAHIVHNVGTYLMTAAHGLSDFFASI
jgi:hypothetical protein